LTRILNVAHCVEILIGKNAVRLLLDIVLITVQKYLFRAAFVVVVAGAGTMKAGDSAHVAVCGTVEDCLKSKS
jgi:hypothetical protein